jgi:hypothetical protein
MRCQTGLPDFLRHHSTDHALAYCIYAILAYVPVLFQHVVKLRNCTWHAPPRISVDLPILFRAARGWGIRAPGAQPPSI